MLCRYPGNASHQFVEMAEVVVVGHGVIASARRIGGERQRFVEHVELEGADARVLDEPIDLIQLCSRHHGDMVRVVGIEVPAREIEHFREYLSIRSSLVEVVMSRSKITDQSADSANKRGP